MAQTIKFSSTWALFNYLSWYIFQKKVVRKTHIATQQTKLLQRSNGVAGFGGDKDIEDHSTSLGVFSGEQSPYDDNVLME